MNWEQISYNIEQFWNKPIPIIGFTVGFVVIGILWIIAKTSIGKKALKELRAKYEEATKTLKEIKDFYNKVIEEKDNQLKKLTEMYESKLALVQANKEREEKLVLSIAKNINNVKIKKLVEEYEKLPQIEQVSEIVKIKVEEKEALLKPYEEKLDGLIVKIESKLEELQNGKIAKEIKEQI